MPVLFAAHWFDLSNFKKTCCLVYIGDEILPSYIYIYLNIHIFAYIYFRDRDYMGLF